MARKVTSFADKLKKKQDISTNICSVCNTETQRVMFVKSVKSERSKSWRYNQNMVNVCKCTEKNVYPS